MNQSFEIFSREIRINDERFLVEVRSSPSIETSTERTLYFVMIWPLTPESKFPVGVVRWTHNRNEAIEEAVRVNDYYHAYSSDGSVRYSLQLVKPSYDEEDVERHAPAFTNPLEEDENETKK